MRKRLEDYYRGNPNARVRISLLRGGYNPTFTWIHEKVTNETPPERVNPITEALPKLTPLPSPRPQKQQFAGSHKILLAMLSAVLAVSIVVALYFSHPFATEPPSYVTNVTKQITTYPGSELFPALSPDGQQVAFSWDGEAESTFHICVKYADDSGTPLQLTTGPNDDVSPVWSPNEHTLAFVRLTGDGQGGVYTVPMLGGSERKIVTTHLSPFNSEAHARYKDWSPEGRTRYVDWSPDGKWLVAVDRSAPAHPLSLILISDESRQSRQLTAPPSGSIGDTDPRFSPDGRFVSFERISSVEVTDLYVVSIAGGQPRRITYDNRRCAGHTWTSDGKQIVFSSDRGGNYALWRVSIAGGAPVPINAGDAIFPTTSRIGHRLAYSQLTLDDDIWTARVGSDPRPNKLISSTRRDVSPEFSPDGMRIAFASDRSGSFEIWVCDRDGQNARQLTSFNGPHTGTPRWSPDGQWLAFDSRPSGNPDIFLISSQGGSPQRLTTNPAEDVVPSWSQDGRRIYFASNRSGTFEVWEVGVNGSDEQQVTHGGGFAARQSGDGSLYYTRTRADPQIWVIPPNRGALPLPIRPSHWSYWSPALQGIAFVAPIDRQASSRADIWLWNAQTRRLTKLLVLPKPISDYTLGFSLSPDNRSVLYSQIERRGSDLMMIENFH